MKITLTVEYDDTTIGAARLADTLLDLEGVEGVEIGDWE